jgi:hypothetical protein
MAASNFAEPAFGCRREAPVAHHLRLRHQESAEFGFIESRDLRPPILVELPTALRAAQRVNGNSSGAERLHVAVDCAHGYLQLPGKLVTRPPAAGLQLQENREQPVRFHGIPPRTDFSSIQNNYDTWCHIGGARLGASKRNRQRRLRGQCQTKRRVQAYGEVLRSLRPVRDLAEDDGGEFRIARVCTDQGVPGDWSETQVRGNRSTAIRFRRLTESMALQAHSWIGLPNP